LALTLSGCTTVPQRSDAEVVKERATARWSALVAGDMKTAYEMVSPAGRTVVSFEGFRSSLKQGFWKSAQVRDVKCESAELCDVSVDIEYEFMGRRTRTALQEKWVKQDSQWWFLLQS
jgi:hypothetical protein